MASIRVQQLTKRFGATLALDALDLEIRSGELFFLLGASGCGKTTLLRSLAGFYTPDAGRIFFDDAEVTRLPPHKRNTGMMFQSYALWPHMTVAENVAFGLKERRVARHEIVGRVQEVLESVHLTDYAKRKPNQLSGGQQQRVALARALVVRPSCLLLDEPLSNLDAKLRTEMRNEIHRVCKAFELTAVYVTHDQKEALSVADRMAILENGRILQVGTPDEVYRCPGSRAVANFMGETDFLDGRLLTRDGENATVETAIGIFEGRLVNAEKGVSIGAAVTLSIRPECWRLGPFREGPNLLNGRIGHSVYLGEMAQHEFISGDRSLRIYELNPKHHARAGASSVLAKVDPDDVVILTK